MITLLNGIQPPNRRLVPPHDITRMGGYNRVDTLGMPNRGIWAIASIVPPLRRRARTEQVEFTPFQYNLQRRASIPLLVD
jgi:hypothetical protein